MDGQPPSPVRRPAAFVYLYDFGDSWEHDVEVLGPGGDPGLVEGSGACPPEDCGGFPGYEQLLAVLADPKHAEHEHLTRWSAGHSFVFDEGTTAELVQQVLGTVPSTVRAMLTVVGSGIKLTQAAKLPPAVVSHLLELCPEWESHGAVREDNVLEAWTLKELMREVGLLCFSRGVLSPTKAALSGDQEVVRRLRRRFPNADFETLLMTNALAVLAAGGPLSDDDLIARVLPMMGRGWTVNGEPLEEKSLRRAWSRLWRVGRALDLTRGDFFQPIHVGRSGLTLLPRAAHLAHLLSTDRA